MSICARLYHDFWEKPDHKTAHQIKHQYNKPLELSLKCIVVLDQVDSVRQNKLLFQSAYLMSIGCLFTLLHLEMIELSFKGVYN